MFHFTRTLLTAAAVAAGLAGARADERLFAGERFAPASGDAFLSDALYPEMPGANAPVEIHIGAAVAAPLRAIAPPADLPFIPHFGFSTGNPGAGVDGVFFSPADGIELTAKPGLVEGFRGLLGITIHF